jgi:hypothetical protein
MEAVKERPNVYVVCPECGVTLHKINGAIIRKAHSPKTLHAEIAKVKKKKDRKWWLSGRCPDKECGALFHRIGEDWPLKVVSDQRLDV